MNWRRGLMCVLVSASVLFGVGVVFHYGVPAIAPGIPPQFKNSPLFRPWEGWTSTYMSIHPMWFGPLFAMGYLMLLSKRALQTGWRGGLAYGAGLFLLGSFPVFLLAFASFQVSTEVILAWIAQSLCQYTVAGAIVGAVADSARIRTDAVGIGLHGS